MRLLLWALLATLGTLLSSCEAASSNSYRPLQRALSSNLASRGNSAFNGKRFLRSESNKLVDSDDNEERAFSQKPMDALKKIRDTYLKWEMTVLAPAFKRMAEKKNTVTDVREYYRVRMMGSGRWGTPSGFKRFANLYGEYVKKNYPNLAK